MVRESAKRLLLYSSHIPIIPKKPNKHWVSYFSKWYKHHEYVSEVITPFAQCCYILDLLLIQFKIKYKNSFENIRLCKILSFYLMFSVVATLVIIVNLCTRLILKMPARKEVSIITANTEYVLLGPCYHLMEDRIQTNSERPTFISKKVKNHSLRKKRCSKKVLEML